MSPINPYMCQVREAIDQFKRKISAEVRWSRYPAVQFAHFLNRAARDANACVTSLRLPTATNIRKE